MNYSIIYNNETIESDLTKHEADYLINEYNLAFGGGCKLIKEDRN